LFSGRLASSSHDADDYTLLIDRYLEIYQNLRSNLTTPVHIDVNLKESLVSAILQATKFDARQMKKEANRITDVYFNEIGGDVSTGYTVIYIVAGAVVLVTVGVLMLRKKRAGL
jgi:hypothetical protein